MAFFRLQPEACMRIMRHGNADNDYRSVSDLRLQFLCGYRLYLKKRMGDSPSPASRLGTRLHSATEERIVLPSARGSLAYVLIALAALVTVIILAVFG